MASDLGFGGAGDDLGFAGSASDDSPMRGNSSGGGARRRRPPRRRRRPRGGTASTAASSSDDRLPELDSGSAGGGFPSTAGSSELETRHALARVESAQIMSRKFAERDQVKAQMAESQRAARVQAERQKKKKLATWEKKTRRSPFQVDLLAENERIDEENRVRLREEARRMRALEKRRQKVKTEIILQALAEQSELDALRREKKAIILEEKRLKALLDLEKTNAHRKADLMAAARAERNRRQAQAQFKRNQQLRVRKEVADKRRDLLKQKLEVGEEAEEGRPFDRYLP